MRKINNRQRKILERIVSEIESIKDEEQDKYDNAPENLQGSERHDSYQNAAEALETAMENIQEAIDC